MRLKAESITKRFAGVAALSEVTVSLESGEFLGVIGPNGSGKTTLINAISGVIAPTSGTMTMGEESWTHRSSHEVARSGIARTFQTIRLFSELTVLENIDVATSASPVTRGWSSPRRASREAIRLLGLEPFADVIATTLPYGLQRRVEIARAVATRPSFLLLDEPAAGLNEAESDDLLATLKGLREQLGFGSLIVDHDLRLIMRITDHICVLNEGKLLAEGSPQEIRHNPEVIKAYIGGSANGAEGDLAGDLTTGGSDS